MIPADRRRCCLLCAPPCPVIHHARSPVHPAVVRPRPSRSHPTTVPGRAPTWGRDHGVHHSRGSPASHFPRHMHAWLAMRARIARTARIRWMWFHEVLGPATGAAHAVRTGTNPGGNSLRHGRVVLARSGASSCPPGSTLCLRGVPFGWSRAAPPPRGDRTHPILLLFCLRRQGVCDGMARAHLPHTAFGRHRELFNALSMRSWSRSAPRSTAGNLPGSGRRVRPARGGGDLQPSADTSPVTSRSGRRCCSRRVTQH